MKKTLFLISILLVSGCAQVSNSEESGSTATACAEEPGPLSTKPEKIKLATNSTRLSGSLQKGKDIGYSFEGKKGQELSYSLSSDTVCAVVYAWNLETIDTADRALPEDGEYTIQLSSLEENQAFDLDIGLDVGSAPVAAATPTTTATPVETTNARLAEPKALEIVQGWLNAKPKIFAPPFNVSLVNDLAASNGALYKRTVGSSGSVQWLKDNGYYYTYRTSVINKTVSYKDIANGRVSLTVEITEDLSLHSPRGIDRSKSGRSTGIYEYILGKEGSTWKIYDSGAVD